MVKDDKCYHGFSQSGPGFRITFRAFVVLKREQAFTTDPLVLRGTEIIPESLNRCQYENYTHTEVTSYLLKMTVVFQH
jgi:hypothetical protein